MTEAKKRIGRLVAVLVLSLSVVAGKGCDDPCTTDSDPVGPTIISPVHCGQYAVVTTRKENVGGVETDVTVQYMVLRPIGHPKAMMVLFSGRTGNTGITGNPATGEVTATGTNFLVRSAAIFAKFGFLTVAIDRPSTGSSAISEYDAYRISPRHAQDIATVIAAVNPGNLEVFLAGTSRGAISATAQHRLGGGSLLSSPVTGGDTLFVGDPGTPSLLPASVTVPVHVMSHELDGCPEATPAAAEALHQAFEAAGVSSRYDKIAGGFDLTDNVTVFPCDSLTHHGFLGVENLAVRRIVERAYRILLARPGAAHANRRPTAAAASVSTPAATPVLIDLAPLVSDPNGDSLVFSLPHATSSRGAALSLTGSVVTYSPAESGIVDGFVYLVSDGKGGTAPGVVTVTVSP